MKATRLSSCLKKNNNKKIFLNNLSTSVSCCKVLDRFSLKKPSDLCIVNTLSNMFAASFIFIFFYFLHFKMKLFQWGWDLTPGWLS